MTSPSALPASAAAPDETHAFHALGGPCRITLEAGAPAPRAVQAAIDEVLRIERTWSRYRDDSVTARINAAAGGAAVQVDTETADLIDFAAQAWQASGGRFDLTSGVLRRVWDFRRPRLPTAAELQAVMALVGWQQVRWQRPWLALPRPGMELDFGGIGKEYAADRAATVLAEAGVRAAIVNLGGDLRVLGPRRDGQPWRVGIAHPRREGAVVAAVELQAGALATSGDYERFFELDGRRWCHILDATTGWPVRHWQSVSVLAPACTAAGTLATLAMLAGADAPALLQAEGVDWLAIDAAGQARGTAAFTAA